MLIVDELETQRTVCFSAADQKPPDVPTKEAPMKSTRADLRRKSFLTQISGNFWRKAVRGD